MHSALDIVRAAIPQADIELAREILWERTPFPCGAVSARDLYRAASRLRRTKAQGVYLCDWCDRLVGDTPGLCLRCSKALRRAALER